MKTVNGIRWTPHGPARDTERDNPRTRRCPACGAAPMEACFRLRRGGRQTLTDYHDARKQLAAEAAPVAPASDLAGRRVAALVRLEAAMVAARRRAARFSPDQRAYQAWAAGDVVPHRITQALDLRGLYGPEVDEACGVAEPQVDMWEAGELYPAWEALVLLAELTDFPVEFFTLACGQPLLRAAETSLVHHIRNLPPDDEPVLEFLPSAVAAAVPAQEIP
ncbi:zinc finger domain-containing protein [Amycolatopsis kentuckyensis]|uniref:zinc finger domain-containing protein n=1 Tax=Amycolatopsis kentuckyensis TaxID=218823 RepID=UPI003563FC10